MKKDHKETDPLPNHPYALLGFGEILLLISLGMDGLTGAIQDKMNSNHKTDPHRMMYSMNLWPCLYLFLGNLNFIVIINQLSIIDFNFYYSIQ